MIEDCVRKAVYETALSDKNPSEKKAWEKHVQASHPVGLLPFHDHLDQTLGKLAYACMFDHIDDTCV